MAIDANTGGLGGLGGWGAPNSGWQTQAYQDFLGRTPNADESGYWGGKSFSDFLTALPNTQEYRTNVVNDAYHSLAGRDADPSGLSYWSTPDNFGNVWSALQNSDEGRNYAVNQLYQTYLGRAPDQSGLDYWRAPNNYQTAINGGIANSDEARQRAVSGLYNAYLGQQPDAAGLAYWSDPNRISDAQQAFLTAGRQNGVTPNTSVLTGGDAISRFTDPYRQNEYWNQVEADNPENTGNWTANGRYNIPLNELPMPNSAETEALKRAAFGEGGSDLNQVTGILWALRNRQAMQYIPGVTGALGSPQAFGPSIIGGQSPILRYDQVNGLKGENGYNPNSQTAKQIEDLIKGIWGGQIADPTHGATFWLGRGPNGQPLSGNRFTNAAMQAGGVNTPVRIGGTNFFGRAPIDIYNDGTADWRFHAPSWYGPQGENTTGIERVNNIGPGTLDAGTPTTSINIAQNIDPNTLGDYGSQIGSLFDAGTNTNTYVPNNITPTTGVDPGYGNGSGNFGQGPDWVGNSGLMTTVNGGSANNGSSPLTSGTPYVNVYDYSTINPYGFDFQMPW